MGTIATASIVTNAQTILQDTLSVRWPGDELTRWLNDGQREVVLLKPEASTANESVALVTGTKQTIPPAGVSLIRVIRNMGGSPGTTPGKIVRLVNREVMDAQSPDWHTDAALTYVKLYFYDPLDPRTYYVYPQAPAGIYVEIAYSKAPADAGTTITLDDIYANALLDYVLYRAYSKDAEYAANSALALAHYTAFGNSIAGKTGAEMARNPNRLDGGANPNVPK